MPAPDPDSASEQCPESSAENLSDLSFRRSSEARRHGNRLSDASSPYLLQHASNPVDWYPWGESAFGAARAEDRPMFISIGYATCHWCHVMERESFENETIAAVLNDGFIPVKVDREEHPDVDHFYMSACTAGGRRGGWPLTILALPDGRPFYAATYLPPFATGGHAGLIDVLERIAEMWLADRDALEAAASDVTGLVERLEQPPVGSAPEFDAEAVDRLLDRALQQVRAEYDAGRGGFGGAPKFPVFHRIRFLLAHAGPEGREMALATLESMRAGGIWDHVGHGFHRYSTDRHWHLPHFEKMLYDQAMALAAYAEAWAVSGDPVFQTTTTQIAAALERDFRLSDGLMASAWDADSEGEEGRYYVWTRDELSDALALMAAPEDALGFLEDAFSVREEGNFTEEATRRNTGSNILDAGFQTPDPDLQHVIDRFEPVRRVLIDRRARRVAPLRDEKRLADWNGLYAAGAALAGRLTGSEQMVDAAERTTERLLAEMRTRDGAMMHRKFGDRVGIEGGIDDYAMPALACLELFEATGRPMWLEEADALAGALVERFFDEEAGRLGISLRADIPVAQTRLQDEAYPSGTGVALRVMSSLVSLLDRPRYRTCLERVLSTGISRVGEWPTGHLTALDSAAHASGIRGEIVVVGSSDHPLRQMVRRAYTPSHVHIHVTSRTVGQLMHLMPFLGSLFESARQGAVFVCTDRTCELPITDAARLEKELGRLYARRRTV